MRRARSSPPTGGGTPGDGVRLRARVPGRGVLVLPLLALSVASCSSEATPEVSGGAQFTLRNANIADNPDKLGSCPDIGTQFTVAQPFYVAYLNGSESDAKTALGKAMDAVNAEYAKSST